MGVLTQRLPWIGWTHLEECWRKWDVSGVMGVHGCRSHVELRQGLVGVCPCFLLWDHSRWTDIMWWVLWCILRPIFLPDSQSNEENGFLIAAIAGGYVCCRVLGKIHDLGEVYALPLLQQERATYTICIKTEDPHQIHCSYICMQDFVGGSYECTRVQACPGVTLLY